MTEVTAEQIAAQKQAEAQAKAEAAAAKKAEKEQAKAEAAAKREAEKAEKLAKKQAEKEAKEAAKAAAEQARAEAKAAKEAAKEAAKQPEQNGIRAPRPGSLCAKAWDIFNSVSAANGSPASIGESMKIGTEQGLNDSTMRTQYARWRKFHGVTGHVADPTKPAATTAE